MAKPDIWMPLYIADYMADTNRLSTVQHGAYLLLIMDYWRNGRIPNDRDTLLQITRLSADAWSMLVALLEQFFTLSEDGKWVHSRLEEELQSAKENSDKSRARAKLAAETRWNNAKSNAQSIQQALPEQCPSPSPSPLSNSPIGESSESGDSAMPNPCPQQEIVSLYNQTLAAIGWTAVNPKLWKDTRADALRARWREDEARQNLDWWAGLFDYVQKSDWLAGKIPGRNGKPFKGDLEWLVTARNFRKVCEGKYHD